MTIDHTIGGQSASANNSTQMLLSFNVPEKIVIVYDSAIDEENTAFQSNGEAVAPNEMLKRSIYTFIANKAHIDRRHEFALVVMNASGFVWLSDFTSNTSDLVNLLNDVPSCEPEDIISMDGLFQLLNGKIVLPAMPPEQQHFVPPYGVRVLFTYGRSFTLPHITPSETLDKFVKSPCFTFDILMTHETPSSTNKCAEICKRLQRIDVSGLAYFLPVQRNASELHFSMAKLLGHPLQRPLQSRTDYKIKQIM